MNRMLMFLVTAVFFMVPATALAGNGNGGHNTHIDNRCMPHAVCSPQPVPPPQPVPVPVPQPVPVVTTTTVVNNTVTNTVTNVVNNVVNNVSTTTVPATCQVCTTPSHVNVSFRKVLVYTRHANIRSVRVSYGGRVVTRLCHGAHSQWVTLNLRGLPRNVPTHVTVRLTNGTVWHIFLTVSRTTRATITVDP